MSKAVEGAALLGGAALLFAGEIFATGGLGAALNAPFVFSLMEGLAAGGVAMEAGAIASALTSNRGMNITTRQAAANRQIIYGTQRVGGNSVYVSTTGSTHSSYNWVIVLAGHQTDGIINLYLDGRQVHWDGTYSTTSPSGVVFGGNSDGNTYTGPNGVQYNFGGLVFCKPFYGNQTNEPDSYSGTPNPTGGFSTSLYANDPVWGPSAQGIPYLGGCTYVYLKIEFNQNMFPQAPEIRFTINGKPVYDPRTSTTAFSTNWALIINDILTDTTFGLGDTSVNQDQLIAAANVCDEQIALAGGGTEAQFACSYHYDTATGPGDVLNSLMEDVDGRLSRIGGEWFIWPPYWQGPSFSFDDNSLTSAIQWTPYRSTSDLFNRVRGTYTAPQFPYNIAGNLYDANGFWQGQQQNNFEFAFQPTSFPEYAEDTEHGYSTDQYLSADGGRLLTKQVTLSSCLSVSQAQRVAKIKLERNRQQGSGTFEMNLHAWQMQPTDVMQFTFAAMGWTEKVLEVTGVDFTIADAGDGVQSVRCSMGVQETAATVYEWSTSEEQNIYASPIITSSPYTPEPPTNMTLTSGASTAIIALDGTLYPRIKVQWDAPADILVTQVQVQYETTLASPPQWLDAGLVDVANTTFYIPNVVAGQEYNVRIRSLRANGATSTWEEIDGYTVSKTLSVIGILALAPGDLVAEAYTAGGAAIIVNPFTAVIGNASVSVLPAGAYTITGLNQTTLYWVYWVDPTFAGGAITPIATTNSADFLNKPGYFLIDSITTPYAAVGSGGTGTTSSRYAPSSFADTGTRTTANPANAYDGNSSSSASMSASANAAGTVETGTNITYSGFPAIALPAISTLNIIASATVTTGSTATATVTYTGGSGSFDLTSGTSFTLSIPASTPLNSIRVEFTANAVPVEPETLGPGMSATPGTVFGSISEIYVQS